MLPQLDPVARTVLAQVGRLWLAAVVDSGLSRAGKSAGVPLRQARRIRQVRGAVGVGEGQRVSVGPDDVCTSSPRAGTWKCCGGRGCTTARGIRRRCPAAAYGGHLEVVEVGAGAPLPVGLADVCVAAAGGHLEVVTWALSTFSFDFKLCFQTCAATFRVPPT